MIKVYYKIVARDKNGEVKYAVRRKSKSFVKNFMNIIYSILTNSNINVNALYGSGNDIPYPFTDVDNYLNGTYAYADEGDDKTGIIVGSGTTPPTPDDYELESQIPQGDGDNQLHYGVCSVSNVKVSGNEITIEITRSFVNNGSVSVTVSEVGLVLKISYKKEGTYQYCNALIIRDVLDNPVTVPAGGSLDVKYTIKVVT